MFLANIEFEQSLCLTMKYLQPIANHCKVVQIIGRSSSVIIKSLIQ